MLGLQISVISIGTLANPGLTRFVTPMDSYLKGWQSFAIGKNKLRSIYGLRQKVPWRLDHKNHNCFFFVSNQKCLSALKMSWSRKNHSFPATTQNSNDNWLLGISRNLLRLKVFTFLPMCRSFLWPSWDCLKAGRDACAILIDKALVQVAVNCIKVYIGLIRELWTFLGAHNRPKPLYTTSNKFRWSWRILKQITFQGFQKF